MEDELNSTTVSLIKTFKNGNVSLKGFLTSTTGITIGITALALAFVAAYKAFEHFHVSIKETQEKIDELTESLKGLQSEYDSLNSKSSVELTSSEKERLKYLSQFLSP